MGNRETDLLQRGKESKREGRGEEEDEKAWRCVVCMDQLSTRNASLPRVLHAWTQKLKLENNNGNKLGPTWWKTYIIYNDLESQPAVGQVQEAGRGLQ